MWMITKDAQIDCVKCCLIHLDKGYKFTCCVTLGHRENTLSIRTVHTHRVMRINQLNIYQPPPPRPLLSSFCSLYDKITDKIHTHTHSHSCDDTTCHPLALLIPRATRVKGKKNNYFSIVYDIASCNLLPFTLFHLLCLSLSFVFI